MGDSGSVADRNTPFRDRVAVLLPQKTNSTRSEIVPRFVNLREALATHVSTVRCSGVGRDAGGARGTVFGVLRRHNRTRSGLALIVALLVLTPSCWFESTMWYESGMLYHVPGRLVGDRREGAWLYFRGDGTVLDSVTIDGVEYDRTGFYENGQKVRELTEEELRRLVRKAMDKMAERGFRFPPETERLAR